MLTCPLGSRVASAAALLQTVGSNVDEGVDEVVDEVVNVENARKAQWHCAKAQESGKTDKQL